MIDVTEVKKQAEQEHRDEKMKKATKVIKDLLVKRDQAKLVLDNVERELSDAYASIGEGTTT